MRKIQCDMCESPKNADGAYYTVFDHSTICESCRYAVVEWFHGSGMTLASHPFLDEFMSMDRRPSPVRVGNK